MVPVVGLEPTRHRWQRILSPPRLPFQHTGMREVLYNMRGEISSKNSGVGQKKLRKDKDPSFRSK